jgi:Spy/CpxP family protein refolding chaperone
MKKLLATIALALACLAPPAMAQDRVLIGFGPHEAMPGMMMDDPAMMFPPMFLSPRVGLDEEQRKKVRQILSQHHPAMHPLFEKLRRANEAFVERLLDPTAKKKDLDELLRGTMSVREELMREGLEVALAVRAVMTPEQLAKAVELRNQMRDLRKQMHELMGPPFEMHFGSPEKEAD